ncbi:MAG TPA: GTP-binding protein [Thermoflexales bacterium]|nr:GTP-binding protein [Thermoflexales bacterium]
MSIPITIITGFLGAGKTTLLNRILRGNHGLRVAVLVNDFGAINIDAELIVGVEGETVSLANGCICCTIRDDLLNAVLSAINRPEKPEYVVIETSGVSDPFAVASTFLLPQLRQHVFVDGILTVVDAEQARDLRGEQAVLAMDQIAAGDMILLNKIDLVSPAALEEIRAWIREIVPNARILEVTNADAPLELLLSVGEFSADKLASRAAHDVHTHEAGDEHEHTHTHDHSLVFSTASYTCDEPLNYAAARKVIDALPAEIYRAKGVLFTQTQPGKRMVLQMVGKRVQLLMGEPWGDEPPQTRLVFIGAGNAIDAADLRRKFDACRASAPKPAEPDKLAQALDWVRGKWKM